MQIEEDFNKKAAAGDFAGIGNAAPTGFATADAVTQFHKLQADALQTIGGQKYMAQQNQNTTTLLEANSLGIQPVRDASGQPDFMATNAAILAKKNEMARIASENSPSVIAEKTRADSMEKIAGIKADVSTQNNQNTNAARVLKTKLDDLKVRVASGTLPAQEAQILSDRYQQEYKSSLPENATNGNLNVGDVSIPVTPQAKATNYVNSLFAPAPTSQ